ncbi:Chaperone J-domain containing protein [Gracilaria domingensis]|nr:Chaperone J-domain containing protein [Gracilaria domingensis]
MDRTRTPLKNLRALLGSLGTVLYSTATWKAVSMDVVKEKLKVQVNYHKAILQVHSLAHDDDISAIEETLPDREILERVEEVLVKTSDYRASFEP